MVDPTQNCERLPNRTLRWKKMRVGKVAVVLRVQPSHATNATKRAETVRMKVVVTVEESNEHELEDEGDLSIKPKGEAFELEDFSFDSSPNWLSSIFRGFSVDLYLEPLSNAPETLDTSFEATALGLCSVTGSLYFKSSGFTCL